MEEYDVEYREERLESIPLSDDTTDPLLHNKSYFRSLLFCCHKWFCKKPAIFIIKSMKQIFCCFRQYQDKQI